MESIPLPECLQGYSPQLLIALVAGGLIVLLIFVWLIAKLFRGRIKTSGIVVQSFQLAPLGRDAFLKITNPGEPVILLHAQVIGRSDVIVKNDVTGQQIPTGGSYSILLEAGGDRRLDKDFSFQFTFVDEQRRAYHQVYSLNPLQSVNIKRKR
jgi:hypothetical protein